MRARFLVGLGMMGLLILLTTGIVLAQDQQLSGKLRTGSNVTIPAGETVDHDLYVFGGTLISDGTITGDLVVAGGTVDVNGPVKGDVFAAGGRVSINGSVGGDLRVAGGQVVVGGDVTEDLAVAGGQVTIGGHVGGDLLVSAGDLTLSGSVGGSTTGSASTYQKTGTITGSDGIRVTGRQGTFTPPERNPVLDAVRQFIAVLLVAVLALWLIPRAFVASETNVRELPLNAFGWGILIAIGYVVAIIATLVVAIILAILFGALGFGALLGLDLLGAFVTIGGLSFAFIVVAAFLADAIVGLALARVVAQRTRYAATATQSGMAGRWADLGLIAVGAAVVVIVTSVPVLGWVVKLIVVALGLGALWLAWRPVRLTPASPASMPPPVSSTPPTG